MILMDIYIDDGRLGNIRTAFGFGIVSGITTNPSLLAEAAKQLEGRDLDQYLREILSSDFLADRPVSLQVPGGDTETMYSQAMKAWERYRYCGSRLVIKIPINPSLRGDGELDRDGLKTVDRLSDEAIPVNVTLIMTPSQALAAADAGARYVSPFAGRIDDYLRERAGRAFGKGDYFPAGGDPQLGDDGYGSVSGVHLVKGCVQRLMGYPDTKVLAASTRNARQLWEFEQVRARITTAPLPVIEEWNKVRVQPIDPEWRRGIRGFVEFEERELFHDLVHPKTIEGMQKFTRDVREVRGYVELFS